ncbi:MAG: hypothetical protein JRE40_14460, partial [Deltaproteobacteria bacterium]|nr:hypothetical protein [Deltaproteobacteria bacterium]
PTLEVPRQSRGFTQEQLVPQYRITGESGPDHDKTFEIEASIGDIVLTIGTGKNRKDAEQDAAGKALRKLGKI